MSEDVELVELRGAWVEHFEVRPDAELVVDLGNVAVYVKEKDGRTFEWAYTVRLVLGGVSKIAMSGAFANREPVDDGVLRDAQGKSRALAGLVRAKDVASFALSFTKGASLDVAATRAHLILQSAIERRGEWKG